MRTHDDNSTDNRCLYKVRSFCSNAGQRKHAEWQDQPRIGRERIQEKIWSSIWSLHQRGRKQHTIYPCCEYVYLSRYFHLHWFLRVVSQPETLQRLVDITMKGMGIEFPLSMYARIRSIFNGSVSKSNRRARLAGRMLHPAQIALAAAQRVDKQTKITASIK